MRLAILISVVVVLAAAGDNDLLLSLPEELIDPIIDSMDVHSMASLALTCRRFRQKQRQAQHEILSRYRPFFESFQFKSDEFRESAAAFYNDFKSVRFGLSSFRPDQIAALHQRSTLFNPSSPMILWDRLRANLNRPDLAELIAGLDHVTVFDPEWRAQRLWAEITRRCLPKIFAQLPVNRTGQRHVLIWLSARNRTNVLHDPAVLLALLRAGIQFYVREFLFHGRIPIEALLAALPFLDTGLMPYLSLIESLPLLCESRRAPMAAALIEQPDIRAAIMADPDTFIAVCARSRPVFDRVLRSDPALIAAVADLMRDESNRVALRFSPPYRPGSWSGLVRDDPGGFLEKLAAALEAVPDPLVVELARSDPDLFVDRISALVRDQTGEAIRGVLASFDRFMTESVDGGTTPEWLRALSKCFCLSDWCDR